MWKGKQSQLHNKNTKYWPYFNFLKRLLDILILATNTTNVSSIFMCNSMIAWQQHMQPRIIHRITNHTVTTWAPLSVVESSVIRPVHQASSFHHSTISPTMYSLSKRATTVTSFFSFNATLFLKSSKSHSGITAGAGGRIIHCKVFFPFIQYLGLAAGSGWRALCQVGATWRP